MVSAVMPTATQAVSVGDVLLKVKAIQDKDVFKFCDESAQNQIKTVATLLDDIDSGRCPKFVANASEWLLTIKAAWRLFCQVERGSTELVGAAAASPARPNAPSHLTAIMRSGWIRPISAR